MKLDWKNSLQAWKLTFDFRNWDCVVDFFPSIFDSQLFLYKSWLNCNISFSYPLKMTALNEERLDDIINITKILKWKKKAQKAIRFDCINDRLFLLCWLVRLKNTVCIFCCGVRLLSPKEVVSWVWYETHLIVKVQSWRSEEWNSSLLPFLSGLHWSCVIVPVSLIYNSNRSLLKIICIQ